MVCHQKSKNVETARRCRGLGLFQSEHMGGRKYRRSKQGPGISVRPATFFLRVLNSCPNNYWGSELQFYNFSSHRCSVVTLATMATCYWPDHSISDYTACNSTADRSASQCCAPGDECTATGFCYGASNSLYRGSCTDPTWKSYSCPYFCTGSCTYTSSNCIKIQPQLCGPRICADRLL